MARKTYTEYAPPFKAMVAVSILSSLYLMVLFFLSWFRAGQAGLSLLAAAETLHLGGGPFFSLANKNLFILLSLYVIPASYLLFLCRFSAGAKNNVGTGLIASVVGLAIAAVFRLNLPGVLDQLSSLTGSPVTVLAPAFMVAVILALNVVLCGAVFLYDRRFG